MLLNNIDRGEMGRSIKKGFVVQWEISKKMLSFKSLFLALFNCY